MPYIEVIYTTLEVEYHFTCQKTRFSRSEDKVLQSSKLLP